MDLVWHIGMATDEHYNEPGELIEPLEDPQPTDMPATKGMFVAIIIVAAIGMVTLMVLVWVL
ncbi:MAG: hypothetical protein KA408_05800 [Flavobacteriales bacterium]|nr:hypothetical protein [Flavobacteriales bacterium]